LELLLSKQAQLSNKKIAAPTKNSRPAAQVPIGWEFEQRFGTSIQLFAADKRRLCANRRRKRQKKMSFEFKYMANFYKLRTITLVTVFVFFACLSSVQAQTGIQASEAGLESAATGAFGTQKPFQQLSSEGGIAKFLGTTVGFALQFIGILFMILIIWGGFIWMTARGNEQQITKAKDIIISAVVGLIIVLAAYSLTRYIGTYLTSPNN
jgi:hypothetical protein